MENSKAKGNGRGRKSLLEQGKGDFIKSRSRRKWDIGRKWGSNVSSKKKKLELFWKILWHNGHITSAERFFCSMHFISFSFHNFSGWSSRYCYCFFQTLNFQEIGFPSKLWELFFQNVWTNWIETWWIV